MTLPEPFSAPAALDTAHAATHRFPLEWVLSKGAAPLQYRAIASVAQLAVDQTELLALPLAFTPAMRLAIGASVDGVWNGRMLSVPASPEEEERSVGTIPAVHRLLEVGLPPDLPSLASARRPLFRLLSEDNDPAFLYELAADYRGAERRAHGRLLLREGAAAALAHLGYQQDPRLRGCTNRIMERVCAFLMSPLSRDPWTRLGNRIVLSEEAAPPSIALLVMLAHMPHYRHEHHSFLELLREYLIRDAERPDALVQLGGEVVARPDLVLGNPLSGREAGERELPMRLFWLELFARLGWLERHEPWRQQFDRLVDGCDRSGVWRAGRGRGPVAPLEPAAWGAWNLDPRPDAEALAAEVTTRLGIIARASGREIALV